MPGPLGPRSSIGRLRHRVLIQSPEPGRSKYGDEKHSWPAAEETAETTTVWCEVRAASGRELFASGQVQAQVSHRVTMRHRPGLTPKDRLVWVDGGNLILNIVAVLPSVGAANMLDVWCLQES